MNTVHCKATELIIVTGSAWVMRIDWCASNAPVVDWSAALWVCTDRWYQQQSSQHKCQVHNRSTHCSTKIANKSSMSWTEHQRMIAEISERQERDRTLPNRVGSLNVWTDKNTIATWTAQVVGSITYNHQNSNNQVKMKALQTLTHSTQFHLHLNGQLDTTILTWIIQHWPREVGSGIIKWFSSSPVNLRTDNCYKESSSL